MHTAHLQSPSFTLAIHGSGALSERFEKCLRLRFPNARVFAGLQSMGWSPPSGFTPPSHAEVADIDALFSHVGDGDHVTLRFMGHHRFFNCTEVEGPRQDRLVKDMVNAVGQLLDTVLQPPAEKEEQAEDV